MARVRVEPSGIELTVPAGVTLMQAARDAGYFWPNACDMQCRCSNCFFRVVQGGELLSAMGRAERGALLEQRGRRALDEPVRLGCQVLVEQAKEADDESAVVAVVIHKIGVREDPFA